MMTDVKHTPWTVEYEPQWPWHIKIEPDIIRIDRVAYSSKAKTIEDVRNAVGFPFKEREEVQRLVAEQEDLARLIAAAPKLLKALKEAVNFANAANNHLAGQDLPACTEWISIIAEAEGMKE